MVTFRLYPEPGRTLYVRINVHPTKKAMRAHVRGLDGEGISRPSGTDRHAAGFSTPWHVLYISPKRCRRDPCIAEVNLCRTELTMRIVTHELLHATMEWARRIRFPFSRLGDDDQVNEEEERIAYAHCRLCAEFMIRATAVGLYA